MYYNECHDIVSKKEDLDLKNYVMFSKKICQIHDAMMGIIFLNI